MSEIRANTISDAAGTGPVTLTKQSAAKAWVNFNGTGTIAERDSFNVSSLTDNGTGDYTVNFSNAFGAADYTKSTHASNPASGASYGEYLGATPTVSAVRYGYQSNLTNNTDYSEVSTVAHGDLA